MINVTIGDKVNALVTEVLVKHNVTLIEFRSGPVTQKVIAAATEMVQGSVLLDRSFLQQYAGIPHTRMHNILRNANR